MLKKYFGNYKKHKFITNMVLTNVLIVSIPIIMLGIISYNSMYISTTQNVDKRIDAYFDQMSRSMDDYFESINIISKVVFLDDSVLNILRNDPDLINTQQVNNVNKFLATSTQLSSSIQGMYIFTNTGKQFGTVSHALSTELMGYIEKNMATISQSNGIVMASGISDKNVILAVRRIKFKDNLEAAGIGIILISSDKLLESAKNAYDIAQFKLFIADAGNRLIVATDLKNLPVYNLIIEEKPEKDTVMYNQEEYYVREMTVANTSWRFIAIALMAEIRQGTDSYKTLIEFSVIFIVILAISITILFNLSASRQLRMLLDAFNKVSAGNFKTRIENLEGGEFEYLGEGFNTMVNEVRNITANIFKTQQRLYEVEIQKNKAEFYGLQSQINSHFLYNTLSSIRGMARTGAVSEVDTMTTALISMLRYGTNTKDRSDLKKELEHVGSYVEIQKKRTKNLKLIMDIAEETKELSMLRLTIQPIVENSIIHGFGAKRTAVIKIVTAIEDNNLIVRVLDNGMGILPEKLNYIKQCLLNPFNEDNHIGIVNIEKRIRAVYGEKYGLSISSFVNIGTVVQVKLPASQERTSENEL